LQSQAKCKKRAKQKELFDFFVAAWMRIRVADPDWLLKKKEKAKKSKKQKKRKEKFNLQKKFEKELCNKILQVLVLKRSHHV
jgi:hypothetical protein